MRKPIQIAATERGRRTVYALCDDGTMWITKNGEWTQIKYIPQDPDTGDKCETLTFHGINKQASEINSALDAENERLTWKLEIAQKALREISMGWDLSIVDIAIKALGDIK